MVSLWAYPWTFVREGVDDSFERLADLGVESINLAAHYHSVRSLQPRVSDHLFESYSGGAYFAVDDDRYDQIVPIENDAAGLDDPIEDLGEAAAEFDIETNAWTVINHNSMLGETYPNYAIVDAFGSTHTHSLCPSSDAVQSYYSTVVEDLVSRGVSEIQLEKLGYPSVFHGHDMRFGHDKRQVFTSQTEEWLLSQCFCGACREKARDAGVDVDAARSVVRTILSRSVDEPHSDPPPLSCLVRKHPVLASLFEFRRTVVAGLLESLAEGADDTPINVYLMDGFGADPGDGWVAGTQLRDIETLADRATVLCYESDTRVIQDRLETVRRSLSLPIDAGVSLDPDYIDSSAALSRSVDTIRSEIDGRVFVYNYSLMSESQLQWLDSLR